MPTTLVRKYGWKRQLPDHRDFVYLPKVGNPASLPPEVDLRTSPCQPPVYDQGELGSCGACATGGAWQFVAAKQGLPSFVPSRLFMYYNARDLEGSAGQDSGTTIRDEVKALASYGVCPESSWQYDTSKFAEKPPVSCYTEAVANQALKYEAVDQDLFTMKSCLAEGYPIIVGISVYESFESDAVAQTGVVPVPALSEQPLGGHALLCVGYLSSGQWVIRNSWGADWGLKGFCLLPKEYLLNSDLAGDFWALNTVR